MNAKEAIWWHVFHAGKGKIGKPKMQGEG